MLNSINSPLFFSIFFPALTVLGCVPLLRWATNGDKQDIVGSAGVGLACFIGAICAFGRVGEPFQFGVSALVYGIGFVTVASLMVCLFFNNNTLRLLFTFIICLVWVWIMTGMALAADMLMKASLAGSVLLLLSVCFVWKGRAQYYHEEKTWSCILAPLVLAGTLAGYAFGLGDQMAGYFAVALAIVLVLMIVWTLPVTPGILHENAFLPVYFCLAALTWEMWLQGHLPLLSILCLVLVLFSDAAARRVVETLPIWLQKTDPLVRIVISFLPVGLSIVFFDIFRSL